MLPNERLGQIARRQTTRRGFLSGSAKLTAGGTLALVAAGSPLAVFANDTHSNQQNTNRAGGMATLTAALQPVNNPDAFGFAKLTIDLETGELCFRISAANIDPATDIHIHDGMGGSALVSIDARGSGGLVNGCTSVDQALAAAMVANAGTYVVDVHTGASSDAVLRGHLTVSATSPGNNQGRQQADCDVLNYALTLEHLEANFYIQAVETFSEAQMEDYIAGMNFGPAVSSEVYQRVVDVRDHEVTHVETLISVLESLGCDPVPPCEYDFSGALADVATFFATSQVLEDTGVMAYDGAIDLIESRTLQTAAATIATVEARHASYFRLLNQLNPFPAPFDEPIEPAGIIEAVLATGLIISCPVAPPVPDMPRRCTP